jgi:hypothetical protein
MCRRAGRRAAAEAPQSSSFFLRGSFVFVGLSQLEKVGSAIVSHSALSREEMMSSPKSREIDFAELSDGSLVEMIRDPADAGKTLLAIYRDQFVRYAESVEDQDTILVPLARSDQDLRYVRLAQGAEPYGKLLDLEKYVAGFFYERLDVGIEWQILMTSYAICSWLAEKLPVAPYLAFVGPPSSGKTTAMRVLNLVCYRSLLTADISSAAFYDVSHRIRPTVLLDETLTAGHPRELMHLLRASSTPGFVSLRKDQARLAYGPKVFSWLELPDDPALNSRCVIVPMHRTSRTDLKSPNDPSVLQSADKVRMQLQQFRFEHYKSLPAPRIPSHIPLSGRPLDLYRALALPFDQDQDMCDMLADLIAQQDKLQAPVLSPAQASVLHVLYTYAHKHPDAAGITVSALTAFVNSDLASRGESVLNERKMGEILTSLSLTNRTRKNTGYFLWLDRSARERIHTTVRDYGAEDPVEKCEICAKPGVPRVKNVGAEDPVKEGVQLEEVKSERREHRERRSRSDKRLRAAASSRLRSPQSRASDTD